MYGDYTSFRKWFSNKSSKTSLAAGDTTKTLVTARSANHQLYVQRVVYNPVTVAAQAVTIKDNNGTALVLGLVPASQATPITFDFGPEGIPLTAGKDLLAVPAAAGPAAVISADVYEKPVSGSINTSVAAGSQ